MLDEVQIRKAISTIIGDGNLFECRIIYNDRKQQPSGYFRSADNLINCLRKQRIDNANVYIVLNRIKKECEGREQNNRFIEGKNTTQDKDIETREWILVDFDSERPSGTSSTDAQVEIAKKKAGQTYKYLQEQGFPEPIIGFSGNGYHLLYKLKMQNNDENKNLLKNFLSALDIIFSEDDVHIDTVNYNAARICKLYGTVAHKGSNTAEQPHRLSKIVYVPKEIIPVKKTYIEKIANSIKVEMPQANRYNGYNGNSFDLDQWLNEHGLNYRIANYSNGQKYILDHCPFDHNHKGKDAVIFKMANGAIGFKCFHNSCSDKTWRDVRLMFEPDAYTRQWQEQDKRMYKSHNRNAKKEFVPIVPIENRPIFLTAKQILERPAPDESFIKTGFTIIDKKMRGLKKDHTSIWSGLRASAKSTALSQIVLNAVQAGCTAVVYSGELSEKNFMRWMNQQAAGHHNQPSQYEGYYNTPIAIQYKIADWLGEKFYLYDNQYGNNFESVIAEIEKQIQESKADLVVLDNLMAFNISSLGYTKWEAQSAFVWKLHEMANKYHVHIAFVAHPKKAAGFLRFDDISGTADLGNAVDDAFIVHRNNEDFKRLTSEMFKWKSDNEIYNGTNVIEIVKDRDGGTQDVFVPLYYEVRSKRLKNSENENVVYGWDTTEGFEPLKDKKDDFETIEDEDLENLFT